IKGALRFWWRALAWPGFHQRAGGDEVQALRDLHATEARLFGLADRKGALRPGLDADIAVFDPRMDGVVRVRDLHGALDHTIWENTALHGRVTATYLRGDLVYDHGDFLGEKGAGRYQKCNPVAPESPSFAC
ncbi:MAG TPA: amidohydrolase family protein, partial [Candidatus Limiplasma sp.]|nr:amidohydrolase family protein [Candidatus Limiplasma sp.]